MAVDPEHGFTDLVVLAAGSTDLVRATPFENQCELLGAAVESKSTDLLGARIRWYLLKSVRVAGSVS